jgi:recombinational DNA repair protein (RecF pathway)
VALARGRTFEVVTQVSVGHAWLNLRDSLESAATAWYLAELADRSLEERHAAEPIYTLLKHAYGLLDAGMAPGRVARWFEMHLADELGVRPRSTAARSATGCSNRPNVTAGGRQAAASSASAARDRRTRSPASRSKG